jgi:hypothetical protein
MAIIRDGLETDRCGSPGEIPRSVLFVPSARWRVQSVADLPQGVADPSE